MQFQVAGVDAAANGLIEILCRFRHVATHLGPMFTKPYTVLGQLQERSRMAHPLLWRTTW